MKINGIYLNEYKNLIQSTNLQKGYQEFVSFFRAFRTFLAKNMSDYTFTGNIVENNMDYSYFQFTNDELKSKGLKFVIAFVHKEFTCEVWLSGMNRNVQINYHKKFLNLKSSFSLTPDPKKFDYILKKELFNEIDDENTDNLFEKSQTNIEEFIKKINKFVF